MIDIKLSNVLLSRITGLFNTIFSAALALASIPFIISKIDLLGYGQWSVIWIFLGIAAFLDLGLSKQLVQNIAKTSNQRDIENFISGAKKSFTLIQSSIVLIHVIGFLFANNVLSLDLHLNYFFISLVILSGSLQFNLYKSIFEGLQKVYISNIYSFFQTLLFYLFTFLAIDSSIDTIGIIFASSCAFVVTPLIMFFHQLLELKNFKKTKIKYLKALGMYLNSVSFFHFNVVTGSQYLIARSILFSVSPVLHGIFDVGLKIGISCQSLLNSLTLHVHAQLRQVSSSIENMDQVVYKNFAICLALFVLGNLIFFFLGDLILRFLFNSENTYFWINFFLLLSTTSASVFEPFTRGLWAKNQVGITTKSKYLIVISILISALFPHKDILLNITIGYSIGILLSNIYVYFSYKHIIKSWKI